MFSNSDKGKTMKIIIDEKELNTKRLTNGSVKLHKIEDVYFLNGTHILFCKNLLTKQKQTIPLRTDDLMDSKITPDVLQKSSILMTETDGYRFIRYAVYNHPHRPSKDFNLYTSIPSCMPSVYTKMEGIHTSRAINLEDTTIPLKNILTQTAKIDKAARLVFNAINTDLNNIKKGHLDAKNIPSVWLDNYLAENLKHREIPSLKNEAREVSVLNMLGAYFCINKGIPKEEIKTFNEIRKYFDSSTLDYVTYFTSHSKFREAIKNIADTIKKFIQTNPAYMARDKAILMTFLTRRQDSLMLPNIAPERALLESRRER